jgi:hypothetical protein
VGRAGTSADGRQTNRKLFKPKGRSGTRDKIGAARRRGSPSQRKGSTLESKKTDGRGSVSLRTSGSPVFLGAAEPGKLRVQRRDGLGRRRGPGREDNSGVWLRLGVRLRVRTPVAGLSFAAARGIP